MHLNRATDIALRILMFAGARGSQVTIDELAAAMALPRNHVAKVVQRLQHHGFVVTARGRGGGVRLADGVLSSSAGHVVRYFEGDAEVVNCDEPPCPLRDVCRLRGALHVAQEAFFASLDEVPLTALVAPPTGPVLLSLT
ncbi:Rrf2 family transcriptional regulator [Amycolatopsis sp. NPDC048633]|uniref:RrF2 family transcriptional regulator n=1 Tax=Amycolatopsis sp. NPDC048633 TaxID=3157095 RepID=UPI00340EE2C1